MKILYVCDLLEQVDGVTYQALKEHFTNEEINTISISYDEPSKAIDIIEAAIKEYDLLIASGLGCYLSIRFTEIPKILINFLYPNDVKEQFNGKEEIYKELIDCGMKRDKDYDYKQEIYNQENTFYLFGTEDEIKNNISGIDCEIQFEIAGCMFLDGPSPFSGIGFRYNANPEIEDKYFSYGRVYEVYSTKHKIDAFSTNCLEAIDECIERINSNNINKEGLNR